MKAFAKVFFALTVIGVLVFGAVSCSSIGKAGDEATEMIGVLVAIGIMVAGTLAAWFSAVLLHAFGEMVENTAKTAEAQAEIKTQLKALYAKPGSILFTPQGEKEPAPDAPVVCSKICPKCQKDNPADYLYCQHCGEKLN